MVAKTTALTSFQDKGNSRTSITSGHDIMSPKMVIESRTLAKGTNGVGEYRFKIVHGTDDADGNPIPERISAEGIFRVPVNGDAADLTAVLNIWDDLAVCDELHTAVGNQVFMEDQS